MTRWEPDARGRLEQAALDLFAERGYDQTTVLEIAERAGVTKRTFFRHFADKREALFGGSAAFRQLFVDSVDAVPPHATAVEAMTGTLQGVGAGLGATRERAGRRQSVIGANPELQERELAKMADVTAALDHALAQRGVPETLARVTAEVTGALFRTAFEDWLAAEEGELSDSVRAVLDALGALTNSGAA